MQRSGSVVTEVDIGGMEMVSMAENDLDGSPLSKAWEDDDGIRALIYTTCYNVLDG